MLVSVHKGLLGANKIRISPTLHDIQRHTQLPKVKKSARLKDICIFNIIPLMDLMNYLSQQKNHKWLNVGLELYVNIESAL